MELTTNHNNRILPISFMRVMAMFMIILFHSLYFYTNNWWILGGRFVPIWYKIANFLDIIDLPMFMFISGYLYGYLYINENKYRDKKAFVISKFKRLLIPYLSWALFQIIVLPTIFDWQNILTGSGHLWFLLVLFEIFTIIIPFSNLLCNKFNQRRFELLISLSIFVFFLFHFLSNHHSFLCIHSFLYYFPSFLIGIYIARFKFVGSFSLLKTLLLLFFSLIILGYYISYSTINNIIIDTIFRLSIGWIIIILFYYLLCSPKITASNTFTQLVLHFDKLSMGIYIFHQIIINICLLQNNFHNFINSHFICGPFIIFAISFVASWAMSYFFYKNKYINRLIGF